MTTATSEQLPVHQIYRWDLDKTYLRTEFETIRGLIRTALQKPEDKTNVPGAVSLLRELSRPVPESRSIVTFVSGSPTQMRDKLMAKFALDGIAPDRLILKPTLQNILKGRFRAVRGQVGYKLESLLRLRGEMPIAPETMFGDDAEQDAFIYSIYADIVAGRLDLDRLRDILVAAEVYASPMQRIFELVEELDPEETVGRIFINLEGRTAPGRFLPFGARVVPIVNYFQAALVLWADGVMDANSVFRVAAGMIERDDYGLVDLSNSFQDVVRRRVLGTEAVERFAEETEEVDVAPLPPEFASRFIQRVRALAPRQASDPRRHDGNPPDYLEILRADTTLKKAVTEKRGGLFD